MTLRCQEFAVVEGKAPMPRAAHRQVAPIGEWCDQAFGVNLRTVRAVRGDPTGIGAVGLGLATGFESLGVGAIWIYELEID